MSSSTTLVAGRDAPAFAPAEMLDAIARIREPLRVVRGADGRFGLLSGDGATELPLVASLPAMYPEWLGDRSFGEVHGVRFPYVTGAMANGIATTRLVAEMGRAGFLGFFGAGGLPRQRVEQAVDELTSELGDTCAWGCNLIHSPLEPALEEAVAALYVARGVKRVSAAAYMSLTPAVVRFALAGVRRDPAGHVVRERHVFAKISRPETARRFLEPAPADLLEALVTRGWLTADEARIGREIPVAEDITVESDSGGHTDNRPLGALFPAIAALRDQIARERGYARPIRIGAAGGIGTPAAAASAFALGAAYVLTGSVNQACVESGLSEPGREMLAQATLSDVIMAPAADMFELGVELQVLRRGTMFGVRAKTLYELYKTYPSLEAIPAAEREKVETGLLRQTFEDSWASTRAFWADRDPGEVTKAEADPKHKMALVFRSYLGLSSRWAIAGVPDRRADYQIWCGPAMGAFNAWTAGTFLAEPGRREAVQVARNLMEGAAVLTRAQQLRSLGVPVPAAAFDFRPRPLA